jgi:hypothetical protein
MPSLTELLATWEAGLAAGDADRASLLHALARPDDEPAALLALPVGTRDADLVALRRALFGDEAALRVSCVDCGEEMEFGVALGELVPDGALGGEEAAVRELDVGEWTVRFRLPTPADLVAAAEAGAAGAGPAGAGPARARQVVLDRCVVGVSVDGRPAGADELPAHVQERIAEAAAVADPHADIRLDVPCPECGNRTKALFDIGTALWTELDAWARRTLLDVHLLAGAYGWTEPDVLALSPLRRRYYLELAGHA